MIDGQQQTCKVFLPQDRFRHRVQALVRGVLAKGRDVAWQPHTSADLSTVKERRRRRHVSFVSFTSLQCWVLCSAAMAQTTKTSGGIACSRRTEWRLLNSGIQMQIAPGR